MSILSKSPIKHSKSATFLRNLNWAEDPFYFLLFNFLPTPGFPWLLSGTQGKPGE
jgi:hypothetical protein